MSDPSEDNLFGRMARPAKYPDPYLIATPGISRNLEADILFILYSSYLNSEIIVTGKHFRLTL